MRQCHQPPLEGTRAVRPRRLGSTCCQAPRPPTLAHLAERPADRGRVGGHDSGDGGGLESFDDEVDAERRPPSGQWECREERQVMKPASTARLKLAPVMLEATRCPRRIAAAGPRTAGPEEPAVRGTPKIARRPRIRGHRPAGVSSLTQRGHARPVRAGQAVGAADAPPGQAAGQAKAPKGAVPLVVY
jgi:hypothetical protein